MRLGIPVKSKAKEAAYLYCQWATSKQMLLNLVNMGGGASPRLSTYQDPDADRRTVRSARSGSPR